MIAFVTNSPKANRTMFPMVATATNLKRPRPSSILYQMVACNFLLMACTLFEIQRNGIVDALFVPSYVGRKSRCLRLFPGGDLLVASSTINQKKTTCTHSSPSFAVTILAQNTDNSVSSGDVSTNKKDLSNFKKTRSNRNSYGGGNQRKLQNKGKHHTVNFDTRQKTNPVYTKPWKADYATSFRTQKKIQAVASQPKESTNYVRVARDILQSLLESPPTECNPANIVCALTLSAKIIDRRGSNQRGRKGRKHGKFRSPSREETEEYRVSLMKTLDILQTLVSEQLLSPRQLCNSAWAVAKHVNHDKSLYSSRKDRFVLVKDGSNSCSTWDLKEQIDGDATDKKIDELFNIIALRMIEHLQQTRDKYGKETKLKRVQPGELSMLLWAYANAKPRDCPPGWEQPRRVEKMSIEENRGGTPRGGNVDSAKNVDVVTFVELDDEGKNERSSKGKKNDAKSTTQHRSITSRLFDSTAIAFCQGEGSAVKESDKSGMLRNCTFQDLSNIAWSYASHGACGTKQAEALMMFVAKEAMRRMSRSMGSTSDQERRILPRDITQIAWALGTMESDNSSVGDVLVHLVDAINDYWIHKEESDNDRPLKDWRCADLVQLATALSHGRLDNRPVLIAIFEEAMDRLIDRSRGFTTSEISILMWVQARLYLTAKIHKIFGSFPSSASRALLQRMQGLKNKEEPDKKLLPAQTMRHRGLGSQEQANLAWSLTVLEQYDDNVTTLLQNVFHAASSNEEGMIQLEHAHQLWQAFFVLSEDCPDAVKFLSNEFSQYLEKKWNEEKGRLKQSSSRHKAISQTLNLMKVAHRNEYDEDVDVAIVLEENSAWTHTAQDNFDVIEGRMKVAVEFDGPHHFSVMASSGKDLSAIANGAKISPRVLGHTVLKYRLLKKKGWTVVRIPYYEFDKIPFWASMERQRYLQRALKTHDKIQFSGIDVSEYKAMVPNRHSRFD